jgi:prolipoprotein diacylglyceryltransferase
MKTQMIIETAHGGIFFSLTYLAAVLVAAGMTIFYGYRKGYPKSTWLLILVTGLLFFVIGEKVASYTSGQWMKVLTGFQLPEADKKTILGGITGLFAGLILAKKWLKFNRPVLDSFALALPIAMAISRIGCLMAGCCFGTPTSLPWGIHYDPASLVYQVQLARGLIHLHDETSLAVHPVQLYQIIGCLLIALIVWRTRKHWKAHGSLFLFSVLCYAFLRFLVEFVRDPESNFILTQVFLGMKILQWLILGTLLAGVFILIIRESKFSEADLKGKEPGKQLHDSGWRQVFLSTLLSVIVLAGRKWFDPLELLAIMFFLVPVITAIFVNHYLKHSIAGYRWIVPVLLVCSFSFMSQTSITGMKNENKITFTDLGIFGMVGRYSEDLLKVSRDCSGISYSPFGKQSVPFYQAGLNYSYNIWKGRYTKYSIGGRVFYGYESPDQATSSTIGGTVIGISPYASLNWHWFGFRWGFSAGQMNIPIGMDQSKQYDGDIIAKGKSSFEFIPSLSVRIGPADYIFAEGSYASALFPYSSPFSSFYAGLGTGFGRSDGTLLSIGLCGRPLYIRMVFPIRNKFVVEAFYADNFSRGADASRTVSVGFTYRFINTGKYKEQLKPSLMGYHAWVDSTTLSIPKLKDSLVDIDGNVYSIFAAGGRVWMAEDLKVRHYRDGSAIPYKYTRDSLEVKRYDWYSVSKDNGLCPAGWHVPSLDEWTVLINSLGSPDFAAAKLQNGFSNENKTSKLWSSNEANTLCAYGLILNSTDGRINTVPVKKPAFLNVRCIKDK